MVPTLTVAQEQAQDSPRPYMSGVVHGSPVRRLAVVSSSVGTRPAGTGYAAVMETGG